MLIVKTIDDLLRVRSDLKGSIGFVPTMGALHNGHISLIKDSIANNKNTIVSIFVNPTQFLVGEDLDKYPSNSNADIKICELLNIDVLFIPNIDDIYFKDELLIKAPYKKSYILEGFNRPAHFDGVLQVVLKLFNLVKPNRAYFGKKDAQQLYLIQDMVKKLFLNIDIISKEIIRDSDGLALSSRNVYLSIEGRNSSLKLPKSLIRASNLVSNKVYSVLKLKEMIRESLDGLDIEYIEIVNRDFDLIDEVDLGNTIILVAIKVENTRLIDNIWI